MLDLEELTCLAIKDTFCHLYSPTSRTLPNGNTELGVHIADVTYFVAPGSLTDQEAQSRSTTVYLADRRYGPAHYHL